MFRFARVVPMPLGPRSFIVQRMKAAARGSANVGKLVSTKQARRCVIQGHPVEPRRPQYYRLQGPTFLLEFDNSRGGGTHIHSVWRDFVEDFGQNMT